MEYLENFAGVLPMGAEKVFPKFRQNTDLAAPFHFWPVFYCDLFVS